MTLLLHCLVALEVCGRAGAFTLLSPFSYSSLSFKNLLNSVLLSSNANLAGGGRNLKSDVLEDASLITVSLAELYPSIVSKGLSTIWLLGFFKYFLNDTCLSVKRLQLTIVISYRQSLDKLS